MKNEEIRDQAFNDTHIHTQTQYSAKNYSPPILGMEREVFKEVLTHGVTSWMSNNILHMRLVLHGFLLYPLGFLFYSFPIK
jgi:hypothetical protein